MARSLIDIGALDTLLQEALGKVACGTDFHLTVWQQKLDATGCNWNAHFERIGRTDSTDIRWWAVVPLLRATTNLAPVAA